MCSFCSHEKLGKQFTDWGTALLTTSRLPAHWGYPVSGGILWHLFPCHAYFWHSNSCFL